ncbi:Peptidase C1 and/or Inhibitor I29 domain containing protein [Asbolus verrucosus]|uniref:Peptidase C1 and/or Inhibitor I29 domain containing protein n=1 Tax=Asbolus verrucosus TaxID=1661398 RepID=A0A482VHD3_ASBVE|nr:Peptidase C1 and/or Inhibitor I29 domain containing protein [Asbolus verrucosus]
MKCLLVLALAFLGCLAYPSEEQFHVKWASFKKIHQKSYDSAEELKRRNIFKENLKKIEEHNQLYKEKKVTYEMGVNQFADLTREEFSQYLNRYKDARLQSVHRVEFTPVTAEIPAEIDWRKKGAVTEVKDQGQCGSCWAFSVTGSLEGENFLKNGRLVSLSEQELVDCSDEIGNEGCGGGFMEQGFEYVIKHGLVAEEDYPYEAFDGKCRRGDIPAAVNIDSYVVLPTESEEDLQAAVGTIGPVSVAVDATDWQFYSRGVFYDSECSSANASLNHGVLAVGYGVEGNDPYWLVKNSWGPYWGEDGYIKSARNADNNCGIATDATYPNVL